MTCPGEFTLAMYADGELLDSETQRVREHLAECPGCRELAASLHEENRALVHALQEMDLAGETGTTRIETAGMMGLRLGLLVIGCAIALRAVLDWIAGFGLPAMLEWVDPSQTSGQLNLAINSILYFIMDGGSMLISAVNTVSFAALNLLLLFGLFRLLRRSTGTNVMLGLIVLTVFSAPGYAIDVRRGAQQVTVAAGETVDDTLVIIGETINIDGTVNGDAFIFARFVTVRGVVKGDIIGMGQRVDISGMIEGNIFGFAETVQSRGRVMRNMYGFAKTVSVSDESQVDGNVTMFSSEGTVDGTVGRDLMAFGERLDVRGNVGSDILSYSGRLTLSAPAHVGGNLTANVPRTENARVADGATVAGRTDIRIPEARPNRYSTLGFYFWQAVWLAAAFVTGLVLFWLFPALSRVTLDTGQALLKAGGIGFIGCVAIPVAAVVIGITLIGLPVALIGLFLWAGALYLAKIVIAGFLGRALLRGDASSTLMLLAGLVVIYVAINLPFVGGLINFLLTLIGFGTLLIVLYRSFRPGLPPVSQPVT